MNAIISHYVKVELKGNGQFEVWLVEETFDLSEYQRAQIKWAMECPYNRNGVREKMGWSDKELDSKPSVLLKHFIEQHGDDWFRDNLRPKFIKTRQKRLTELCPTCTLAKVQELCHKCDKCLIANLAVSQD